jgi:hypothetical protein
MYRIVERNSVDPYRYRIVEGNRVDRYDDTLDTVAEVNFSRKVKRKTLVTVNRVDYDQPSYVATSGRRDGLTRGCVSWNL